MRLILALNRYKTKGNPFLDRTNVTDHLIANENRYFNNFRARRNADTLEWLGMAPIDDSGSSLGFDKVSGAILSMKNIVCKPFKKIMMSS